MSTDRFYQAQKLPSRQGLHNGWIWRSELEQFDRSAKMTWVSHIAAILSGLQHIPQPLHEYLCKIGVFQGSGGLTVCLGQFAEGGEFLQA